MHIVSGAVPVMYIPSRVWTVDGRPADSQPPTTHLTD